MLQCFVSLSDAIFLWICLLFYCYIYCSLTKIVFLYLLQGRIFRDVTLADVRPAERSALYVALSETLSRLHSFNVHKLNLTGYGKGKGYCQRQVKRATYVYLRYKIPFTLLLAYSCGICPLPYLKDRNAMCIKVPYSKIMQSLQLESIIELTP